MVISYSHFVDEKTVIYLAVTLLNKILYNLFSAKYSLKIKIV
jgi:hypothetical protein